MYRRLSALLAVLLFASAVQAGFPEVKLTAGDDARYRGLFGQAVDIDGDLAVVGADGEAFIFERTAGAWARQAQLISTTTSAAYGYSVSISGDVAVVGDKAGSVTVFRRNGDVWSEEQRIGGGITFGWSVSTDGNTLAAGALGYCRVFEYDNDGGSWVEGPALSNPGGATFGYAADVDGNVLAVGDPGERSSQGSLLIYENHGAGWQLARKFPATSAEHRLGWSVSVRGDLVVAGSPGTSISYTVTGAAFVFQRRPDGWHREFSLIAGDRKFGAEFGHSVAIEGDLAVVGAQFDGNVGRKAGAAYVFRYAAYRWDQVAKITASDIAAGDYFGSGVAMDNETAIVGSSWKSLDGIPAAGAAYAYDLSGINRPPVADAGPDQSVYVGQTVQFDGSGSYDPDEDPLIYSWSFYYYPWGSTFVFSDPSVQGPTFVPDLPGYYWAFLTVNDGKESSLRDWVEIWVRSAQDAIRQDVMPLISSLAPLNNGQRNSLEVKLEAAIAQFDRANNHTGANQLQAFVNELHAHVQSGLLDEVQAEPLIQAVEAIIAYLEGIAAPKLASGTGPDRLTLRNDPNPFNPQTTIHYGLTEDAAVRLVIYNAIGQRVRSLVDALQSAGAYRIVWDGRDDLGRRMSSGVYIYRLEAGTVAVTRKMLLLK